MHTTEVILKKVREGAGQHKGRSYTLNMQSAKIGQTLPRPPRLQGYN